ncbi:flavin-containing monooxygenase [Nocardia nova]|uniref:flavin-containing monooxygenase n=1 Tax=Nocardia nova TaxID=37330 RepID=UPI0033EF3EF2
MPVRPAEPRSITMTAGDDDLRAALREANLPTLLLVLAQFTGDGAWLREPYLPTRTRALNDNDDGGFPPEIQDRIRAAAFDVIRRWRDGARETPPPPGDDELPGLLSISLGEVVPQEYAASLAIEGNLHPRPEVRWTRERPSGADRLGVIVIGAGFSGVATAVTLRQLGIPFVVIEKAGAPGGVWYQNSYPGAGVDTPSHLYHYAFAPTGSWSRYYAKQPEILSYINDTAESFGVTEHIRFGTEVERAEWDEARHRWTVTVRTSEGVTERLEAAVVISCAGFLNRPSIPGFDGMDRFDGPLFHSSAWDHSVDLHGKRVAVIGTGATSMQIVPSIADDAQRVLVFQRSAQWVAPNLNYRRGVLPEVRLLMEQLPYYAAFYRMRLIWQFQDKLLATLRRDPLWKHPERSINSTNEKHRVFFTEYVDRELGDRIDLRDKVLPAYPPYGKRILMDNGWIETVKRDDVELVAAGVRGFDEHHVLTRDGGRHRADVVVLATGFESSRMLAPMDIRGRSGVPLRDQWADDNPYAYLGITVPDFPNFFLVGGPNTALGHGGSNLFPSECAVAYIAQILVAMAERGMGTVEVKDAVCAEYNRRLHAEHEQLIWTHPGMTTWYRNRHGRVTAPLPWRGVDYFEMTRQPDFDDFVVTASASIPVPAAIPEGRR